MFVQHHLFQCWTVKISRHVVMMTKLSSVTCVAEMFERVAYFVTLLDIHTFKDHRPFFPLPGFRISYVSHRLTLVTLSVFEVRINSAGILLIN